MDDIEVYLILNVSTDCSFHSCHSHLSLSSLIVSDFRGFFCKIHSAFDRFTCLEEI